MKIKELRELSKEELIARRSELKKSAFEARLQHASGQLQSTSLFRNTRKEVAHIETLLSERRLGLKLRGRGAAPAAEAAPAAPKKAAAPKSASTPKAPAAKKAARKKAAKAD